jgi:glycosyltransferase involved in cell wall biosynthesis
MDHPFTVIVVGRLIPLKNSMAIIRAFHESDDGASRLVFVGEGPTRSRMVSECRDLGLADRVEITGPIPRDRVFEYLARSDLYLSASTVEGLPVAAMEAMACRCPVLLSDIPPHREIVEGTALPLVRPQDVRGFSRKIRWFRELSPFERQAMGEKCRQRVQERFSLTKMHREYEQVYTEVMKTA